MDDQDQEIGVSEKKKDSFELSFRPNIRVSKCLYTNVSDEKNSIKSSPFVSKNTSDVRSEHLFQFKRKENVITPNLSQEESVNEKNVSIKKTQIVVGNVNASKLITSNFLHKSCDIKSTSSLLNDKQKEYLSNSTSNTLNDSNISDASLDLKLTSSQCGDKITQAILSKDKSLLMQDKPFSLLSDISDTSISLESIPSISVFNPFSYHMDMDGVDSVTNSENDNATSAVTSVDTLVSPNLLINSNVSVIGGSNIPLSLFRILKQSQLLTESSYPISAANSSRVINNKLDCQTKFNETLTPQVQVDNDNSDTDSELDENNLTSCKTGLTRNDTLILSTNNHSSSCAIKASENAQKNKSLKATNTKKKSHVNFGEETSGNGHNVPCVSTTDIANNCLKEENDASKTKKSIFSQMSTIPIQPTSRDEFTNDIYLEMREGQAPMIRCLSGDLLDISGLLKHTHKNPGINPLSQSCVLLLNEPVLKQMTAKETQTDIVLGTRETLIQQTELLLNINECNRNNIDESSSVQSSRIHSKFIDNAESFVPNMFVDMNQSKTQYSVISRDPVSTTLPQKSSFSCLKCQEIFKSKEDLEIHLKDNKHGFQCDLCNATFTRMGNFTRHRKVHNLQTESNKIYKCEQCGREFLQRCDLRRHLLIHTKKEPFRCEKCNKGYIRRSDLVVHMRFHNKDRAFKCSLCEKRFFQSGDLNRHVRRAHNPQSQLTCGHCDKKYACEATLIRHMKASHKDIILKSVHQKLTASGSSKERNVI